MENAGFKREGAKLNLNIRLVIGCATVLGVLMVSMPYLDSSYDVTAYALSALPSPLKQFQAGTSVENIKCEDGMQLAIKKEDSSPACVKPQTAARLMVMGWATSSHGANIDVAVSQLPATMIKFTCKTFLSNQTKQDIYMQVADSYKKLINPYPKVKYDSVYFEIEVTDYNSQNNTFSIRSNATAKLSGLQGHETYLMDARYNNATGNRLYDVYLIHETKYVPDDAARRAIEESVKDSTVQEFFAKYPTARNYGSVSYLDPMEVQRLKYSETYGGGVVSNNEYSFLPDSLPVILVGFPSSPPPPPGMTAAEVPGVNVYLDPVTFKILGSEKVYWTS